MTLMAIQWNGIDTDRRRWNVSVTSGLIKWVGFPPILVIAYSIISIIIQAVCKWVWCIIEAREVLFPVVVTIKIPFKVLRGLVVI
jgi:hypothetical protein